MAGPRRLVLSLSAVADLEAIFAHIAREDPAAVRKQIERILKTAVGLCDFPEIGRARPYLSLNLRSCVQDKYVVFYYPHTNRIDVVRVLHSRMDIENEMLSFLSNRLN